MDGSSATVVGGGVSSRANTMRNTTWLTVVRPLAGGHDRQLPSRWRITHRVVYVFCNTVDVLCMYEFVIADQERA